MSIIKIGPNTVRTQFEYSNAATNVLWTRAEHHMSDLEQKEAGEYCNARKTDGSGYCQHEAGWGTEHPGHGRCRFHGGNTKTQEQNVIDKLSDAASDAAVAYQLRLKHIREKIEAGESEDIDWGEFDRLGRTVFDRAPNAPDKTEKHEHTGEDGDPIQVKSDIVTVTQISEDE